MTYVQCTYEIIRVHVPPSLNRSVPFIYVSTYTWLNLIFSLFTDNNDVLSQTANCDFLVVQAGWSEYRLVQKRLELATLADPRSTANT